MVVPRHGHRHSEKWGGPGAKGDYSRMAAGTPGVASGGRTPGFEALARCKIAPQVSEELNSLGFGHLQWISQEGDAIRAPAEAGQVVGSAQPRVPR